MSKYRVNAGEAGLRVYKGATALELACTAALLFLEAGVKACVERPAGRGGKGWTELTGWLEAHLLRHAATPATPATPAILAARPGLAKAKERDSGRIPWTERTFRVLSNKHATPKMHETLESAIAHGKRHLEAGRMPVIEQLVKGAWIVVVGWEQSEVSPKLAHRW